MFNMYSMVPMMFGLNPIMGCNPMMNGMNQFEYYKQKYACGPVDYTGCAYLHSAPFAVTPRNVNNKLNSAPNQNTALKYFA